MGMFGCSPSKDRILPFSVHDTEIPFISHVAEWAQQRLPTDLAENSAVSPEFSDRSSSISSHPFRAPVMVRYEYDYTTSLNANWSSVVQPYCNVY